MENWPLTNFVNGTVGMGACRKGTPPPFLAGRVSAYPALMAGYYVVKPKARNRVTILNVAFRFFNGKLIIFVVGFILLSLKVRIKGREFQKLFCRDSGILQKSLARGYGKKTSTI